MLAFLSTLISFDPHHPLILMLCLQQEVPHLLKALVTNLLYHHLHPSPRALRRQDSPSSTHTPLHTTQYLQLEAALVLDRIAQQRLAHVIQPVVNDMKIG